MRRKLIMTTMRMIPQSLALIATAFCIDLIRTARLALLNAFNSELKLMPIEPRMISRGIPTHDEEKKGHCYLMDCKGANDR